MCFQKNAFHALNCNFGTIASNSSLHHFHSIASGLCDPHAWGLHSGHTADSIDPLQVFELWLNANPFEFHPSKPYSSMPPVSLKECPCIAWSGVSGFYIAKTPINLSHSIHSLELYIAHLWNAIVRAVPGIRIPIRFFSIKLLKTSILFCINNFDVSIEFKCICLIVINA